MGMYMDAISPPRAKDAKEICLMKGSPVTHRCNSHNVLSLFSCQTNPDADVAVVVPVTGTDDEDASRFLANPEKINHSCFDQRIQHTYC